MNGQVKEPLSVLAAVVAIALFGGCSAAAPRASAGATPTQDAGQGSPPPPSAGVTAGAAVFRREIAAGSMRLAFVPLNGDSAKPDGLMVDSAADLSGLSCSESGDKSACAAFLTGAASLWEGSKDGTNTAATVWTGARGKVANEAVSKLVLRHAALGSIDLVAVIVPAVPRTENPTPQPAPTCAPLSPSAPATEGAIWYRLVGFYSSSVNGDPCGEGDFGLSSCDPFATIDTTDDLAKVPDADDPISPAIRTIVSFSADGLNTYSTCAL